jgi:penicillin-binding protein 1A
MRAAHQGLQPSPFSQPGGPLSKLPQIAPQVAAPTPPASLPESPTRPTPPRPDVRPEADAGLDGWLIQRLFGQ